MQNIKNTLQKFTSSKIILKIQELLLLPIVQHCILAFVFLCTVSYFSYELLRDAQWIAWDNYPFWIRTAMGEPFYFDFIEPIISRFVPLYLMDFNILLLFSDFPDAYLHYVHVTIGFICFSLAYLYFLKCVEKEQHFSYSLLLVPIFFIALYFIKSFFLIFYNLIFPERILILSLMLFFIFYYKAIKSDKLLYYLLCILFVLIGTYHKEPVFGTFFVIALFNFIFHRSVISKKHKFFNYGLLLNALIFLSLYYYFVLQYATGSYTSYYNLPWSKVFDRIFVREKILLVGAVIAIIRAYFLLIKHKQEKHLFFDATLYAGLAYVCAFIILGMAREYYFVPAVIFILPSIFYWVLQSHKLSKKLPAFCGCIMLLIPVLDAKNIFEDINKYHAMRLVEMPEVEAVAEAYKDGYKLICVYDEMGAGWTVFSQALGLVLKSNDTSAKVYRDKPSDIFEYRKELKAEDIDDKTIVLYSERMKEQQPYPINEATMKLLNDHYYPPQNNSFMTSIFYPRNSPYFEKGKEKLVPLESCLTIDYDHRSPESLNKRYAIFAAGFSPSTKYGRLVVGDEAIVYLKLPKTAKELKLKGDFYFDASCNQEVIISVNGHIIYQDRIREELDEIILTFSDEIIDELELNPLVELKIELPNAIVYEQINNVIHKQDFQFLLTSLCPIMY